MDDPAPHAGSGRPDRHAAGARATADVTVHRSVAETFDESAAPTLVEVRLDETFAGEMHGDSTVRALQVRRTDGSAEMISLQRVVGGIGERQGSFVLRGSQTVAAGVITAAWSVVPGTGTDELVGLRGDGGFEGAFGEGSRAWLDYWFEE